MTHQIETVWCKERGQLAQFSMMKHHLRLQTLLLNLLFGIAIS